MSERQQLPLGPTCPVTQTSYTWHRYIAYPTQSPLQWAFGNRTLVEHTKSRTISEVNFEEFGVTNPLLARALIGLVEIEFITPGQLGQILTSYQKCGQVIDPKTTTHPLSDFLTSAMPNLSREDLYSVHVPLGADVINHPLDQATSRGVHSLFAFLDKAIIQNHAVEAIDAYVDYYSKSVELLHTRGEAIIKYFKQEQPERRHAITHNPIRQALIVLQKQHETIQDAELMTGETAFQTFLATFQRFLPVYAQIMDVAIQPYT